MNFNQKAKDMKSEQILERYLSCHPDYWEYENELKEVERLKSLVQQEREIKRIHSIKSSRPETRLEEKNKMMSLY